MSEHCNWHFVKPGLHTLVQDAGRIGHQESGVPTGGVMDRSSAKIANVLVGNPPDHPVLEITLIGPHVDIEGSCQIALTGAQLTPTLNGEPLPLYETIDIPTGSSLRFGKCQTGCRAYLAIRGEWMVQAWLESKSAASFNAKILTPQSVFDKGALLKIETGQPIAKKTFDQSLLPKLHREPQVIRVLPGPEFDYFSRIAIAHFFGQTFRLSPQSNRMGYRLDPGIRDYDPPHELISSGTVPGTVQITNSGQPIILMTDAQTSGGYFRLVNVISCDMDLLAQLKPGDTLRFELVELKDAYAALEQKKALLKQLQI